ncbi:hypothetical protein ACJ72_00741 [Emergomyces africanus]|uniref:Uncharacterized protein n=1 Tax=Emergomyces africanus TaxID=1955775 RepID=A0A1B7P7B7_9EURO|nr:hypothetical protein ACJ72_00741 [Emergomyces africanus]
MANWEKMASLRKLFNVERTLFQSASPELIEYDSEGQVNGSCSPCLALPHGSPETNILRLPQMQNQIFYGIERQFENLHDQFCCRPSPSLQSNQSKNSEPKPSLYPSRRHLDVVEAGFPAHRARVPTPISPASMYNEEIADRNIQSQRPHRPGPKYANVISAVYQEDVADRNILLGGGNARSHGIETTGTTVPHFNLNSSRSASSLSYYQESWPRLWSRTQAVGHRTPSEETRAELRVISSDQDLRSHPPSYKPEDVGTSPPRRIGVRQYIALRLRSSSPAPSSKGLENSPPKPAPQPQLNVYKITPDRPPTARDAGKVPKLNENLVYPPNQEELRPRNCLAKTANPKLLAGDNASNRLSPASANLSTRKNVPSQPPDMAVATARREPNASIAEIVNSPLPVATPSVVSPRTPSYNVEEIMSMFKHAYISSQTSSSHPTFETLQDAIVREINSHEAFRQVASEIETMPFPETSPAAIPIKPNEESRGHMRKKSSTKSLSGKDKQALRLVSRSSFAKKRRNSYTSGKELSFPAIKGLEGGTEPADCGPLERRRRHTYSQPLLPNVPVAPGLPRELREEARRANLASSGDTPQPKYTYKLIPDVRPKSSHSVRSKGPPSRPGTSGSSKQTQSRRPALLSHNSQPEATRNMSNRSTPTVQTEPEQSKFQTDSSKNGENNALPGLPKSSTPLEPKNNASNLQQQTTQKTPTKRLFSTSPQPLGRNRIPLRRSSLHKDLFDSGRFNP